MQENQHLQHILHPLVNMFLIDELLWMKNGRDLKEHKTFVGPHTDEHSERTHWYM